MNGAPGRSLPPHRGDGSGGWDYQSSFNPNWISRLGVSVESI